MSKCVIFIKEMYLDFRVRVFGSGSVSTHAQ